MSTRDDDGEGARLDHFAIEELWKRLRGAAATCVVCGEPAVSHYRDGRWLCERHFEEAFYRDFGRMPGEEPGQQ